MEKLSENGDQPEITNRYPVSQWRTGNPIDNEVDYQDVFDTDEGDIIGLQDTDDRAYQYVKKKWYKHDKYNKDSGSENYDDNTRDK